MKKSPTQNTVLPFARERALAIQFDAGCPLPPGKRDELAQLLADYRDELRAVWEAAAEAIAKRAR